MELYSSEPQLLHFQNGAMKKNFQSRKEDGKKIKVNF
jgi:hypothetical protein